MTLRGPRTDRCKLCGSHCPRDEQVYCPTCERYICGFCVAGGVFAPNDVQDGRAIDLYVECDSHSSYGEDGVSHRRRTTKVW